MTVRRIRSQHQYTCRWVPESDEGFQNRSPVVETTGATEAPHSRLPLFPSWSALAPFALAIPDPSLTLPRILPTGPRAPPPRPSPRLPVKCLLPLER